MTISSRTKEAKLIQHRDLPRKTVARYHIQTVHLEYY